MLPSLALKSLFSSFSLHFSLSTLPRDVQPGLRVLSFGGWDPDEVFPLMAACLGFMLHSGVCEAEITSYTFFPFFFKGQKGLMLIFIFIIGIIQPFSKKKKKIQTEREVYRVTVQGPLCTPSLAPPRPPQKECCSRTRFPGFRSYPFLAM